VSDGGVDEGYDAIYLALLRMVEDGVEVGRGCVECGVEVI
jgi:hypothetical protein